MGLTRERKFEVHDSLPDRSKAFMVGACRTCLNDSEPIWNACPICDPRSMHPNTFSWVVYYLIVPGHEFLQVSLNFVRVILHLYLSPIFLMAMMNRIKAVGNYFTPGTFLYSGLWGAAVGTGVAGAVYGLRAFHVLLFDEEHYRIQSRQRYLEKQYLFFKELQESQKAHALASLVQEYQPVDTRLPFGKMEDKYRF